MFTHAAKGNGPAQRFSTRSYEHPNKNVLLKRQPRLKTAKRPMSNIEAARRIALILNSGVRELEQQNQIASDLRMPAAE